MNISTTIANGSEYKSVSLKANGSTFSFLQVTGKINYVSIRKESSNPFKALGKEFENWAAAESHYASPDMQIAILCAQSTLSA